MPSPAAFCLRKRRTSKFAPEHVESLEGAAREAAAVPDAGRGPEEDVGGRQVKQQLASAIAALDPKHREVLVLRDIEGLSAAEVGEVLGLSVEAVKSRLHRARLAVRERLAPVLGAPAANPSPPAEGACPDIVELFSRHLEDEISGAVCAEMEAHLQRCERCQRLCDSLRASLRLCRAAGDDEVPPAIAQSVRTALRRVLTARTGA